MNAKSIFRTVLDLKFFRNLAKIIKKAGAEDMLKNKGPFTLFGPYDGAFGTFTTYDPEDILHEYTKITLEEILESRKIARDTLEYLLVPGRLTLEDLRTYESISALNGLDIPITITNGNIIPGHSFLLNSDIECANGIIHVTDEVLRPIL